MKRQSASVLTRTGILIPVFIALWTVLSVFAMTIKEEKELSKEFLKYVNEHFELIKDPVINDYINHLGQKILAKAPPQPFEYRFYVIKEEVYNAFASPAGHIFINSGLFAGLTSEEELAGIIAHEIAHVICRHISKRIKASKKAELASLVGAIAGAFLHASGSVKEGQALFTGAIASGQSFILAYSRENEVQADQVSLTYLNQCGYSAKGLLKALERMNSQQLFGSNQIPTYLKTHPASKERMAYIDTWIQTKEKIDPNVKRDDTPFNMAKIRYTALFADELNAHQQLSNLLKEKPDDGLAHYGYGLLLDRKGEYQKAVDHFRKALLKDALNPSFLEAMGETFFNAGQYKKAVTTLKTVLGMKPKSPLAMYFYGRSQLNLGDTDAAIQYLDGFIRYNPSHIKAHYFLSQAHNRAKDAFHSHYFLGLYYYKKKDFRNSTFHLKKALTHTKDDSKKQLIKALIKKSTYQMKKAHRKKKR